MKQYSLVELAEALRAVNSIIHKCEKAQEKFLIGSAQHTLLQNRLKAMYISKELITNAAAHKSKKAAENADTGELLSTGLEKLHITPLGAERIKKNLSLSVDDVTLWCKEKIISPESKITKAGKNWYIITDGCEITVNCSSYTIITAHKICKT